MGAMSIDEIRERRKYTEGTITKFVAEVLSVFEKETGVNIDGVNLIFTDTTSFLDKKRRIIITDTEIEIKL